MGKKRPERTARRKAQRQARQLVRDREELAALDVGGSAERPIEVSSPAIIEGRARSTKCVQCGGAYHLDDHQAPSALLRVIAVTCQRCGVSRHLWFRIAPSEPN